MLVVTINLCVNGENVSNIEAFHIGRAGGAFVINTLMMKSDKIIKCIPFLSTTYLLLQCFACQAKVSILSSV